MMLQIKSRILNKKYLIYEMVKYRSNQEKLLSLL